MDRRTFLAAAGVGVSTALAGCSDFFDAAAAGENTVGMTINRFRPEELTVDAGTTVEFSNTSSHAHTVTAYEGGIPEEAEFFATGDFESEAAAREGWNNQRGLLYEGESWEYTFEIPGTYQYFCIPHEDSGMIGFIEVEE
ncbi:cupredoxin domain-containing protein [Halobacteriaceae archaeon SHR40]|uniref:cupredoxin domain-containing protein n=1 Tax=Halovenus amylolytica TaxID=2500550 RepID=UPI000FE347F8